MNLHNACKESHFIEAYKKHFEGRLPKRILEIGVQNGGHLRFGMISFQKLKLLVLM